LYFVSAGEKIAGIQYAPESLQGMRENVERILQFMASKRIRMHQITSKEVLEGNLKAVMRLILALAAHYKPQSVRHHDTSYDNSDNKKAANGQSQNQPPPVEETTLNQTQESVLSSHGGDSNSPNSAPTGGVKRTPSLNNAHYSRASKSRLGPDPAEASQIYENFTSSKQPPSQQQQRISTKATIETRPTSMQEEAVEAPMTSRPEMQREGSFVMQRERSFDLQREGSFVRTGSGRKLPKIPPAKDQTTKMPEINLITSLPSPLKKEPEDLSKDDKFENRKSKPKALEFWESLDQTEPEAAQNSEFRYNTIHRMSVGRRQLPKPPGDGITVQEGRSHSLDRGGDYLKNGGSLNSSFSGDHEPVDKSHKQRIDSESSVPSSPPPHQVITNGQTKIPPDGCSLQSHSSAQPGQPSPPLSDSRGEVEGSSDNNSPPTSVIQGTTNQSVTNLWDPAKHMRSNPAYDWLRGAFHGKQPTGKTDEEIMLLNQLRQQRLGDGHSGSDSKHSDTMSDQGINGNIPYDILLHDLTQAKRQLLELHNLVSVGF
jgi:hypothetical protein